MSDGKFSHNLNPAFGKGWFYRRIRLRHSPGRVEAVLEDSSHAFEVELAYEGQRITSVEGRTHRYPLTTCPGAAEALRAFEGQALDATYRGLGQAVNARDNCTHLYDLCVLAIAHGNRPYGERVYDVTLPDEVDEAVALTVLLDGKVALAWEVREWRLVAPEPLLDKTLYSGFTAWWEAECAGDAERFELGVLAQRGYLVSHARRYDHSVNGGKQAHYNEEMLGICHSYSAGTIEDARYTEDSFRDFTGRPEQLLQLFD